MKKSSLLIPAAALCLGILNFSCDDDTSQIGNSLTQWNVAIYIDSLTFDLQGHGVENNNYDSRSGNLLLGAINVPGFGNLSSSFVARLMCSTTLDIPEDVDVSMIDSCEFVLNMRRGDLVGDSLAPQQVNVYRLNNQIPDNITNEFDPVESFGYQNMQLLGSKTFTASAVGVSDSLFFSSNTNKVSIRVPVENNFAREVYTQYKENPQIFQWPQTFAKDFLPGIFVEPSFGNGCISGIQEVALAIFFHSLEEKKETVDDVEVTTTVAVPDTIFPFQVTPEVLSSNNIRYNVAQSLRDKVENGEIIITTPGGYNARISFPAQQIIARYENDEHNLSLISNLSLTIPAEAPVNDYGLTAAPNLLMVKTSEVDNFFSSNSIPDNKTSFTATYDSAEKQYVFPSMREYILNLLNKDVISTEDTDFTLIPVNLSQVSQEDYYGNVASYVTKCTPYTLRPTMTHLFTDKALIVFSFSSQKFD